MYPSRSTFRRAAALVVLLSVPTFAAAQGSRSGPAGISSVRARPTSPHLSPPSSTTTRGAARGARPSARALTAGVSRAVAELANDERWDAADSTLRAAAAECAGSSSPESCRAGLAFLSAYTRQLRASAALASGDSLTARRAHESALTTYTRLVGAEVPQGRLLYNRHLLYKSMDRNEDALRDLARAREVDPEESPLYWRAEADLRAALGETAAAENAYRQVLLLHPEDEEAALSLMGLLAADPDSYGALWQWGLELRREGRNPLAADAFDALVAAAPVAWTAERDAAACWIEAAARAGTLTAESFARSPCRAAMDAEAGDRLVRLLERPRPERVPDGWWRGTRLRRHTWAAVLAGLARRIDAGGGSGTPFLEAALASAPPIHAYEAPDLRDRDLLPTETALELSLRYVREGDTEKFGRLEAEFFNEKIAAIRADDLPAMQRYHTLLGLIYSELGRYSGGGAANAVFQLEHALDTAERRAREDPASYRPLPNLSERLARALRETGRGREADARFLDAAEGYLDLDALREAAALLDSAGLAGADPQLAERRREIGTIVATRTALADGRLSGFSLDDRGRTKISGEGAWLVESRFRQLSPDFVERQQFKALADLGETLHDAGRTREARVAQAEALERASRIETLGGPGDLLRIERAQDRLASLLPGAGAVPGRETKAAGRHRHRTRRTGQRSAVQWTVPQRSGAVDLRVDPALLTWSRVAEALALHPGLEDRVGVEVDSTVVYLRPRPDREVSREELERFADSLRKSRGVERVVIRGN